MDTETLFKIIEMLDATKNFAKEDSQEGFECETNREYRAYVKGQCNALELLSKKLQGYIDNQVAHMETEQGM